MHAGTFPCGLLCPCNRLNFDQQLPHLPTLSECNKYVSHGGILGEKCSYVGRVCSRNATQDTSAARSKKPPRSRSSGPGGQHNMIDQRLSAQEGVINRNTRHPVVRGSMHDNKVTQQLPKPGYRLLLSILQPSSRLLLQLLLPALLYLLIVLL